MHGFFQLFRCNVYLKITTEKKQQPTRTLYNYQLKKTGYLGEKRPSKRLGRSTGVGEVVYDSLREWPPVNLECPRKHYGKLHEIN
ncbi:hypothetical protein TNCV_1157061 [Trichonephila clavipes]|nr:hypothetical protein TNCV_1157061 [Trichonephila clavipes]